MKKGILIVAIVIILTSVTGFYYWNKIEKENDDNYYCTVDGMIDGVWLYDIEITQDDISDYENNSHYQFEGWYSSEKRNFKLFNQDCYKGSMMYAKYAPLEMTVDFIQTTNADIEVDAYYSFYEARVIISKDNRIFTTKKYDKDNTLLVEITDYLELELNETIVDVHFISRDSRIFETSTGRFIVEDASGYMQDKRTRILFDNYTEYDAYAFTNIAYGGYFMFDNDKSVYRNTLGKITDITAHIDNVVTSLDIINAYNTTIGTFFEMRDGTVYSLIPFSNGTSNYHIEQVESMLIATAIKNDNVKEFYVDNGIIYQRYLSKTTLFEFSIPNGIIPAEDTIIEVYGTRSIDSNDTVRVIVRTDNDLYGITRSRTNNEYQFSTFEGTDDYKISSLFNLTDDETIDQIMITHDSTVAYGEYMVSISTSENSVMMFGSTLSSANFYLPTNSDTEIIDYTALLDIPIGTEILNFDHYDGIVRVYLNDGSFYQIDLKGAPYGTNYTTYMDAIKHVEPNVVTFTQSTFTAEDNLLDIAKLAIEQENIEGLYLDSLFAKVFVSLDIYEDKHHYFFIDHE